jgi:hypothetical protein
MAAEENYQNKIKKLMKLKKESNNGK